MNPKPKTIALVGADAEYPHAALAAGNYPEANRLIAIMSAFAFFHIHLTARILGVSLICEVLALTILAVFVIGKGGGPDGLTVASFNPSSLFNNQAAVKVFPPTDSMMTA